ncbi:hypothetical protein GLOIN_2v1594243 [Rhizophagus irregularis DAOM 181602=DAOM 197198]|nr:hypothetical protein GLOIN_2v1594243 [Rhizophagus irregularis DAOM 181602=DAOM 197198]
MEEFLLTREPLDIVRISTALFVRVEKGEWTGNLEKEVENFENILQKVLERVPSEDVERKKKLRNFGTGKKLAKREPFRKYKLEQNHDIMEACKEFIQNEESKINIDEVLGNINYGEWLDKPEELQDLTKRMLKVWKSPKYDAYIKKGKSINEGSYVCEVLAPLLNIVMSDLPGNPIAWDIW